VWPRRRRIAALAIVGLLGACDDDREAGAPRDTSTALATAGSTASPAAVASTTSVGTARTPLPGFGEIAIRIRDALGEVVDACVLLAADVSSRGEGLIGVSDPDLGGYAGMLFQFDEPSTAMFHMRDVPIPLTIAFFNEGEYVSSADMAPCPQADVSCPTYAAAGPFTHALEVPSGRFAALGIGEAARLDVAGACPPPG